MLIMAVVKDPGGTNSVLRVVNELRQLGNTVEVIANGHALDRLPGMNVPFRTLEGALEVMPLPDVYLTSMCSKGGVGRNLIPLMRSANVPIVAIQDLWGAQLMPLVRILF
jgi:hypothetical protein